MSARVVRIVAVLVALLVGESMLGRNARAQEGATGSGPASASASAPASATDDASVDWAAREAMLDESSALNGGVGLLHMQHAQSGAPGQFRLAFTADYFSAGFLCTDAYPCRDPQTGARVTSDSLRHIGGTISLTATLTRWLEAYGSTGAYANSDTVGRPSLLQVIGDSDIGLKAFGAIAPWLHVGGAAELWLINGTGTVGLDGGGTGLKLRGLATADLRGLEKRVPLRFSLNAGYSIDNTGDTLQGAEASRGTSVTRIERYSLQANRVDHVDLAIGGEAFLADDRIRPFVEYGMLIAVTRQGYVCRVDNLSADHCLANDPVIPSKLTLGARVLPWRHGFALTAAFDIGVTGTKTFIEEVAPTAPWTLYLGAGWAFDTKERPASVQVQVVEKAAALAPKGRVKGLVHEVKKTDAISGAVVAFDGHPELTALSTGSDGRFTTYELADGAWTFTVRAEGYKDGTCSANVKGVDAEADCALEALPRVGRIVGRVRDYDTRAAVSGATIKITDATNKEQTVTSDAQGNFRVESLPPGAATLTSDAEGYLTEVQPLDVKARADNAVDVAIKHRPKDAQVAVTQKEITIKQQIRFATGSATILPESDPLLTEIADVFLHNTRIHLVEIQGHADSEGADAFNQTLSEDRANAVRTWLVQHGVGGERLTAKGYGEKKPLVPNIIPTLRQRNRRVQFVILEQDAAGTTHRFTCAQACPSHRKVNDAMANIIGTCITHDSSPPASERDPVRWSRVAISSTHDGPLRMSPPPLASALEVAPRPSASRPFEQVASILANHEDGLTVVELCTAMSEPAEVLQALLAEGLRAGRVRRNGSRCHTRYLLNR